MTVFLSIVGISVVIWSIVDKRHKYYNRRNFHRSFK